TSPTWSRDEDPLHLRCVDQKRRFGRESLFPVSRYIEALTKAQIVGRSGELVDNPLFASGRTKDMISVLLLAGTPWQLIADKEASKDGQLHLLSPSSYRDQGVWERLLGDGESPGDPHLVQ